MQTPGKTCQSASKRPDFWPCSPVPHPPQRKARLRFAPQGPCARGSALGARDVPRAEPRRTSPHRTGDPPPCTANHRTAKFGQEDYNPTKPHKGLRFQKNLSRRVSLAWPAYARLCPSMPVYARLCSPREAPGALPVRCPVLPAPPPEPADAMLLQTPAKPPKGETLPPLGCLGGRHVLGTGRSELFEGKPLLSQDQM